MTATWPGTVAATFTTLAERTASSDIGLFSERCSQNQPRAAVAARIATATMAPGRLVFRA